MECAHQIAATAETAGDFSSSTVDCNNRTVLVVDTDADGDSDNDDQLLQAAPDAAPADPLRLRTDRLHCGFDPNSGDTWIYPTNYPVREYQRSITAAALYRNTLVILPTGLGKTFVAAVLMYNFYRWYPRGRIIFMAPTRPLVAQQIAACQHIVGIPGADTCELTGRQSVAVRQRFWNSRRVFFVTPQMLVRDMQESWWWPRPFTGLAEVSGSASCSGTDVKLLVVDEAHKARGRYAYVEVVRRLHERQPHFRVLALSATPGRNREAVAEIVRNLRISALAVRTERCADVAPFTHRKRMRTVVVRLGEALQAVRQQMLEVCEPYVHRLQEAKVLIGHTGSLSKNWLVMQQKAFTECWQRQRQRHPQHSEVVSNFGICISLYHGLELLERHGVRIFLQFFAGADKFYLSRDHALRELLDGLRRELGDLPSIQCVAAATLPRDYDFGHPKYEQLRLELRQHFATAPEGESRALVFCEYRDSVALIERMLQQERPVLKARIFVGRGGDGTFTHHQQIAAMAEFRAGSTCNVLIATCVAEEGIDVGEIDLIVCFDCAGTNPTRFVQRIGRTGRKRAGSIVLLVTEGREQRVLREVLASRDVCSEELIRENGEGWRTLRAEMVDSTRMVPTEFDPQCIETYIKSEGVKSLMAEDEALQRKNVKELEKIKGVQDMRKFFQPVKEPTSNGTVVMVEERLDVSTPDLSVKCKTNGTPLPKLTDPRILRQLKMLLRFEDDLLCESVFVVSKPTLSTNALVRRGCSKMPKSLNDMVVLDSSQSKTANVANKFDFIFETINDDAVKLPSVVAVMEREMDQDEGCSEMSTFVHDAADDFPEVLRSVTQFGNTQFPQFIDNESRYESYLEQHPFDFPMANNVSCSTPLITMPRRHNEISAKCPVTVGEIQSTKSTNKRLSSTFRPPQTTPIREAFRRVREMQSPREIHIRPQPFTDDSQLRETLHYFQLRSILDVFVDDQPTSSMGKVQLNLHKLSTSLAEGRSQLHEDILLSDTRTDESLNCTRMPAPNETSNSGKAIDLGTLEDIFGSDDDMFATLLKSGVCDKSGSSSINQSIQENTSVGRPIEICSSSTLSGHTSNLSCNDVIAASQENMISIAATDKSLANHIQLHAQPMSDSIEAAAVVPARQISNDMFEMSNIHAPTLIDLPSGQSGSSQKENDVTGCNTSFSRDQRKISQLLTPPSNGVGRVTCGGEQGIKRSPSVLNFGRLRRRLISQPNDTIRISENDRTLTRESAARIVDLSQCERAIDTSPLEESVIGDVRKSNRLKRILSEDDDEDDDNFEPPRQISNKCSLKQKSRRRARCKFLDDECAVSDDGDYSTDENIGSESAMLDSLICNDEPTVNQSMHAMYLQSIRSPRNPYGAYRIDGVRHQRQTINRSDIYSQQVPLEESGDNSDDSFIVHDNDDSDRNSDDISERLSQLDALDRAELVLRQRRKAKRMGIELLSDTDRDTIGRPPNKKRRKIVLCSSNSSTDDEAAELRLAD